MAGLPHSMPERPLNLSSTQAASVSAYGWATSISEGGNDDWQRATAGLLNSYDRSLSVTRCGGRSTVLSHVPHLPLSVLTGDCVAPTAIG
jgi:hypothetical protein